MASKIRILSEQLCNKIAAGEVVERPASVVKELVENSIDAESTDILVEIQRGGKGLIRIVDNGLGMGRDDVFLCLERHATSKIASDEDLFRLRTLGFRGEALPSIASVSRLLLKSCPPAVLEGWEIYAEGGTVHRAGAVGMAQGTTVEIRDLFFNTPARRKFLRKDETETAHIADIITREALARPDVRFRLMNQGRTVIDVYRQKDLTQRVGDLLGRSLVRDFLPLNVCAGEDLSLRGLIAQPQTNRSSTSAMYTYINGRYIRDKVVQHAVLEGYRSLLEKGRYPITVLFLEIDPALVDVNVHPTKHEVRFRDQGLVHDFIAASVRDLLRPSGWLSPSFGAREVDRPPSPEKLAQPVQTLSSFKTSPILPSTDKDESPLQRVQEALQIYSRTHPEPPTATPPTPFVFPEKVEPSKMEGFFASLRIIGQFRRSYILAEDGDDLLLIDQHAAHERIGFERLKEEYRRGRIERQTLLFPPVIEFEFREAAAMGEQRQELSRLGFELEPFGGKSHVLKAVPLLLEGCDPERLLRDVAAELVSLGKSALAEAALDGIFIRMACHAVIRANRPLSPPEITRLLKDLDSVGFQAGCPHGRPVLKRIPLHEVERMFHR